MKEDFDKNKKNLYRMPGIARIVMEGTLEEVGEQLEKVKRAYEKKKADENERGERQSEI